MKRHISCDKLLATSWLVVVILMACSIARATPQSRPLNPQYSLAEYDAFKVENGEKDAQARVKLLDDFAAKFPDSALMPYVYIDYYQSYFSLQNYPQAVAYADLLVALADKVDLATRVAALATRSMAYAAGCDVSAFQTPEAPVKAMNAAAQGLLLLSQLPVPGSPIGDEFAAAKIRYQMIFDSAAGIAELNIKGEPVACAPPRPPQAPAAAWFDQGPRVNLMIQQLFIEQRQAPVR